MISLLTRHIVAARDFLRTGVYAPRSDKWPTARKHWLEAHPTCAACGSADGLQVHHKAPFHLHPELELDPSNFITLCERPEAEHHLHVGHLGNWKNFNVNVEADAAAMLKKSNPPAI